MTTLAEIIGDSAGIRLLREQLDHILKRAAPARRPPSILIRGETDYALIVSGLVVDVILVPRMLAWTDTDIAPVVVST